MSDGQRGWSDEDVEWLRSNYPTVGRLAAATHLGRGEGSIRWKASELRLKQDRRSPFFKDWRRRAAKSKVGKKRPEQGLVMKRLHAEGKFEVTPERRAAISDRMKLWYATHPHPRGMLGKHHAPEVAAALVARNRARWANMSPDDIGRIVLKAAMTRRAKGVTPAKWGRGSWKSAWREIGGKRHFYRSRWEANYARYLEWRKSRGEILEWEHEPETFWFEGIKRGVVSYLPDFRVTLSDGSVEFHEVKGWMDDRSRTTIRRMAKYHPGVVLKVIEAKEYKGLEATVGWVIRGWEPR